MEDTDIINIWKLYSKKLNDILIINQENAREVTKIKIRSLLASMTPLKISAIVIGIAWVCFVDMLLLNFLTVANPFFLISAGIQVLITKLAIGIYLYQLILVYNADISEPILATQAKISRLISSTLWAARILFLQLPLWTTFYLNTTMLKNGNILLYMLQIVVTVSFTYLSIWLFTHIKYENKDKKWFRLIFSGKEWDPVMKAIELLNQIREYENEK